MCRHCVQSEKLLFLGLVCNAVVMMINNEFSLTNTVFY